jgi:hypothetical protein
VFEIALLPLWLFPLFLAYTTIVLGRLGLCGRGLPVTSSRVRWKTFTGSSFAAVLILVGAATYVAFAYWLIVALAASLSQ